MTKQRMYVAALMGFILVASGYEALAQTQTSSMVAPPQCVPAPVPDMPPEVPLVDISTSTTWGPFFRGTERSAHVVVLERPGDSLRFEAFGYDVVSRRMVFHVTGYKRDYARFSYQLGVDLTELARVNAGRPDFTVSSAGQIGRPPKEPPAPGPVLAWHAWGKAFRHSELERCALLTQ
jgi:hypothetical protein